MPTIREVKNKFDALIARQRKVIAAYDAELDAAGRERAVHFSALKAEARAFLPALDDARLQTLSQCAERAREGLDAVRMTQSMRQADSANRNEYARIEGRRGTAAELAKAVARKKQAMDGRAGELAAAQEAQTALNIALVLIDVHNKKYPKSPLNPKTAGEYREYSLLGYIFSPSWRSGYKALRAYGGTKEKFRDDLRAREEVTRRIAALETETLPALRRDHATLNRNLERMQELTAAYKGEPAILETVQAALVNAAARNGNFVDELAASFGEDAVKPLALQALKVRSLDKIASGLTESRAQAAKTLHQLEAPMSKINRGYRSQPSKNVRVDLDKIEKAVNGGAALGAWRVNAAGHARAGVSSYQPAQDDGMANYMNMLIIYMIITADTDPAYANNVFGLDGATAAAVNVDLETLRPDIAAALTDLGQNADLAGLDLGQIDLGNIEQAVGNIDIGTVDVGSITIDTGSFGGFDGGGGGGGDGGGGF